MLFEAPNLILALPELVLAVLAMLLLLLSVAGKAENYRLIAKMGVFALMTAAAVTFNFYGQAGTTFGGMFVADNFSSYMKLLVLAGSAVSLLMATKYLEREKTNRTEYPVLIVFSTLGMMLMISANNLISLYMALELQSLPLYVLAAIQRDSVRSTEAGLKYFVLGALSSGLLLYGSSLIYGFTGATGFEQIASALQGQTAVSLGVVTGMVMILAGLAFKISAVPFHMWAPDVYEGAPTPVTAFFAIAPKVAAIALITRVFMGPFGDMAEQWRQVIVALSIASMALGAVAAVTQTNIKRLLAYSSIGHMGYALIGLAAADKAGIQGIVIYITIYMVMSIGAFCIVLMMKQKDKMVENISDLSGLAKQQPLLALAMSVMMFSMAGIPPLAGFFGKLFIFQSAINAGLYTLAVIGVLTSVVAAYYYIRIIKVMYFENAEEELDKAADTGLNLILTAASLAVVFFILLPSPLLASAGAAAQSLIK
ncbi:MAG: NADH-quinone oxidoreductase subunit NuoN [Alphaproteobacteria bacterium]|nr:NADH-quinone oxidoreductase subunit NuoN [Alphaproteobacteria bacterium]